MMVSTNAITRPAHAPQITLTAEEKKGLRREGLAVFRNVLAVHESTDLAIGHQVMALLDRLDPNGKSERGDGQRDHAGDAHEDEHGRSDRHALHFHRILADYFFH